MSWVQMSGLYISIRYTHDWLGFYAEIQIIFWDSADCEQLHNVPFQGDWCYQPCVLYPTV